MPLPTSKDEIRQGLIEALPVEAGTIDVIMSNCVVNLSPAKDLVYQEAFRVLKPGGRIAISDVVAFQPLPAEVREQLSLYSACIAEGHHPKLANLDEMSPGDRAISMGCGVSLACPDHLGRLEDWGLDDPKGQPIERVREIRDEIKRRVESLVEKLEVKRNQG